MGLFENDQVTPWRMACGRLRLLFIQSRHLHNFPISLHIWSGVNFTLIINIRFALQSHRKVSYFRWGLTLCPLDLFCHGFFWGAIFQNTPSSVKNCQDPNTTRSKINTTDFSHTHMVQCSKCVALRQFHLLASDRVLSPRNLDIVSCDEIGCLSLSIVPIFTTCFNCWGKLMNKFTDFASGFSWESHGE